MDREEIELRLPVTPSPRCFRLTLEGTALTRETRTGTGKPRLNRKTYPDERRARIAFEREIKGRMAAGYVRTREPATAAPILECGAPGWCEPRAFDLSPDGRTLAIGANNRDSGPTIHLVDVATGVRRLVRTDPGHDQVHAVAFTADGKGLIHSIDGQVRRVDPRSGASRVLATFAPGRWSLLQHMARAIPALDRARRRLLVFDSGDRARVLDELGKQLLEVRTAASGDCRVGALSPSGRLLALAYDRSNLIEIWNVDARKRVSRLTFPFPPKTVPPDEQALGISAGMERIGFDSDEEILIASGGGSGPLAVSIDTSRVVWDGADRRGRRLVHDWTFTPDGRWLVTGEWGSFGSPGKITFRDAGTFRKVRAPAAITTPRQPARVVFSADGSRLACGPDDNRISVHALRAPPSV